MRKSYSRIMLCLVLLLGTLLIPATAFAQDECTGRLDPEGEFLTFSQEAMASVSSYASELGMNITLENGPGLPSELGASVSMAGEFAINPEWMAEMMAFQDMDAEEAAENIDSMMELIVELYQTMAFNLDMELGFSTDLANMIAASSGLASFPSSIALPVRMSEGFMYMNLDDIAANFEVEEGVEGWIGIDYGTLMSETLNEAMASMEEGSAEIDAATASMAASIGGSFAMQDAIKQYMTVIAEGVSDLDGVEVCEVSTTIDLAGFLADPAFISMMTDQMMMQMAMQEDMGAGDEMPMTEADIEMVAQMLPMLAPMLLTGLEMESVSWIGVEDGLVYANEGALSWDMSSLANMAAAMAAQSGEAAPLDADNPPFFAIEWASENSAFDEEFEVETPDPVQIIPLEALQSEMD